MIADKANGLWYWFTICSEIGEVGGRRPLSNASGGPSKCNFAPVLIDLDIVQEEVAMDNQLFEILDSAPHYTCIQGKPLYKGH